MKLSTKIKRFIRENLHLMFHRDQIIVVLCAWAIAGFWAAFFINFSVFDPVKRSLSDFKMTDLYFAIERMGGQVKWSNDIVLIDITEQYERGEIAQTIQKVVECEPKTLMVDLIFEKEGDDFIGNGELINAIDQVPDAVLSCKLIASSEEQGKFVDCLKSFFYEFGDYTWAYSNVSKKEANSNLRDYTMYQALDTTTYYSLAYLSACHYMGKQPRKESNNQRTIIYSNTEFPVVHFDSITEKKAFIKNRLAIIGTMTEEADMHFTPVGKMPGMKTQAYAAETYMYHHSISMMSNALSGFFTVIVCLIGAYLGMLAKLKSPRFYLYWYKLIYLVIGTLMAWIGFICFVKYDYDISLLLPLLGLAFMERGRIHYMWFIDYCTIHPQWKRLYNFASKSVYFKPPK